MATSTIAIEQEQEIGVGLKRIAEIAGLLVAALSVNGFLIVFLAISYILILPVILLLFEYYHRITKREQRRLIRRMDSLTLERKIKLHRKIRDEVTNLNSALATWEKNQARHGFVMRYLYQKITTIRALGLESERLLVAATFPNGEELGINAEEANTLRERLAAFEEDWGEEELDEYDQMMAS